MARPVTITISHELGKAGARQRIDDGFQKFSENLGFGVAIEKQWADDRLDFHARAIGQTIQGHMLVRERDVEITVMLPALLAGMAETLSGKLKRETTLLLDHKPTDKT